MWQYIFFDNFKCFQCNGKFLEARTTIQILFLRHLQTHHGMRWHPTALPHNANSLKVYIRVGFPPVCTLSLLLSRSVIYFACFSFSHSPSIRSFMCFVCFYMCLVLFAGLLSNICRMCCVRTYYSYIELYYIYIFFFVFSLFFYWTFIQHFDCYPSLSPCPARDGNKICKTEYEVALNFMYMWRCWECACVCVSERKEIFIFSNRWKTKMETILANITELATLNCTLLNILRFFIRILIERAAALIYCNIHDFVFFIVILMMPIFSDKFKKIPHMD